MSPTRRSFVKAALALPVAAAFPWPEPTESKVAAVEDVLDDDWKGSIAVMALLGVCYLASTPEEAADWLQRSAAREHIATTFAWLREVDRVVTA